ncbi:MAG TPA: hypothetical protein VK846_00725 [Candidatus Limnocylindria bacterium]|nr:hypothetical protein [Candidatus Limnocylindria bacterium]
MAFDSTFTNYATGSQRLGLGIIVVFFTIGLLLMLTVPGDEENRG